MHRRDLLRAIAGALPLAAGITPDELLAVGRAVHRGLPQAGGALAVLDSHQNRTVTLLAEMIIPETDTPGATAARVNEFIDRLLAEWYPPADRDRFLRGLADLDSRSVNAFGARFVEAAEAQRVALVSGLDAERAALSDAPAERPQHFFAQMKWLTLYGYYTSEIGVTRELRYLTIPGRYDPCVAAGLGPAPGGGR